MKKFLIILTVFTLVLAGCSSDDDAENNSVGLILPASSYAVLNSKEFRIQYPLNWKMKTKKDVQAKFRGQLEVAFISNFKDMFFTPVITVEKVAVSADLTGVEFVEEMILQAEKRLIDYELLDRQTTALVKRQEPVFTEVVRFTGKEKLSDDKLEFIQTYLKDGTAGFIITGGYDATDAKVEFDKMLNSLKSFRLN